jgi:predicted acetyltransferase
LSHLADISVAEDERDREAIRRLWQLYIHDLSEYTRYYSLDEEGRWNPPIVDDWLERDAATSLLLRVDGAAAGFSWVSQQPFPFMPRDVDLRLAEFFVAKPFRRSGHGTALALDTLGRFHGTWQLEIVFGNVPALEFWRRVLEPYAATETRREAERDYAFRFAT